MPARRGRTAMGGAPDKGFSLVELLVTLVIAMVILAGLLLSFRSQYGEYKYQNKRIDAVQDLAFAADFIADDIRSSLIISGVSTVGVTNLASDPYVTTDLTMQVWEPDTTYWGAVDPAAYNFRAVRHYQYDPVAQTLRYDRNTRDGSDSPTEILRNVTYFGVFRGAPPNSFRGAPPTLPDVTIVNAAGASVLSPSYTVVIEVAVDSGYRKGSLIDVRGNDVRNTADPRKRVWRYVQAHPMTAL